MLFSAIYLLFDMFNEIVNCVSSEYTDDVMREVVELYAKSRADWPESLQESPPLASRVERPDKAQAVKRAYEPLQSQG